MSKFSNRLSALISAPGFGWVALLLFGCTAYGVLIPWLGYYGDDWSYAWLAYKSHQMQVFFAGNRPLLGEYFIFLTRFLGPAPWHWQLLQLIARWASAAAFWRLLLKVWPQEKALAAAAAVLMLVYPGFELNSEGMNFNPFFFQLAFLFGSLVATVHSLRGGRFSFVWALLALAGALINLIVSEYFYFLELLRLPLIWLVLRRQNPDPWRPVLRAWLPFGLVFIAMIGLRILGIGNAAGGYHLVLFDSLRADPLLALLTLGKQIVKDFWIVTFYSFGGAFNFTGLISRSLPVAAGLLGLLAVIAAAATVWLHVMTDSPAHSPQPKWTAPFQMIAAGLFAMLLAGGSIWAADLRLLTDVNSSRFSMPFIPGACLFMVGLVRLIPFAKLRCSAWAVLAAVSTGFQLLVGFNFVQQNEIQKDFLYQLSLRLPSVSPGTLFLLDTQSLVYNSENSNSALANWLYTPFPQGRTLNVYALQKERRIQEVLSQSPPSPDSQESHMIGDFSRRYLVAIYFHSPNCLRVLDPELDQSNPDLTPYQRLLAKKTDFEALKGTSQTASPPPFPLEVFGSRPNTSNWCIDFAKAGLAAQRGDWRAVAAIGARALAGGIRARNPLELAIFIEADARLGQWQQAGELLDFAARMDPSYHPSLCRLSRRLAVFSASQGVQPLAQGALSCP